jgi:hypothetical protein
MQNKLQADAVVRSVQAFVFPFASMKFSAGGRSCRRIAMGTIQAQGEAWAGEEG